MPQILRPAEARNPSFPPYHLSRQTTNGLVHLYIPVKRHIPEIRHSDMSRRVI